MTDDITDEEKQAENDRLEALEAKQEKNKRRARKPKAKTISEKEGVRKAPGKDHILCVTLKKIALENDEMSEVKEEVLIPREFARVMQENGTVRVVI